MVITLHCSPEGWAEPVFLVNDVSDLANQNQYGLLIGNCCNSNEFAGVTRLGEALLKHQTKVLLVTLVLQTVLIGMKIIIGV